MSTSPDASGGSVEDRLVNLLSRRLAGHLDDVGLRDGVERIGTDGLAEEQAAAVEHLLRALRNGAPPAELEVAVREALEALALG